MSWWAQLLLTVGGGVALAAVVTAATALVRIRKDFINFIKWWKVDSDEVKTMLDGTPIHLAVVDLWQWRKEQDGAA